MLSEQLYSERRKSLLKRTLYSWVYVGLLDRDFYVIRRNIILLQVVGFGLVIVLSWWNEYLDLPHQVFQAPASSANWTESWLETVWMLVLLGFSIVITRVLFKQIRYLEGFLPVCSFCKKIRVDHDWIPIEHYISEHSDVKMTHSLCPICAKKYYGYEEEDEPPPDQ